MIVLRANSWQIPMLSIEYGDEPSSDVTMSSYYGAEVNQFATAYAAASLKPLTPIPNYVGSKLTLKTGSLPFYPELSACVIQSAPRRFALELELRVGSKTLQIPTDGVSEGIFKTDILCQYFLAALQVEFIQARAAKEGLGLGTKERYQLNQAQAEVTRLGAMKVVWAKACEAPMLMNSNGLAVRATTVFCPYLTTVEQTSGSDSGLQSIVASHKTEMISFYKGLYPAASTANVESAMDDSGVSNWFEQSFKAYIIPSRASRSILKSPLLRQLETYSTSEAYAFATKYLTQVVGKAVTDADISSLTNEFFVALKRKGHKVSRARIPEARLVLSDAIKAINGYEGEIDYGQVIAGSGRWSEFARSTDAEGADYHPLLWTSPVFDGVTLSGTSPNGKACAVDVPPYLFEFATLLDARRDVVVLLITGWEDFVASTYSASFSDYSQTASSYTIKTFSPMIKSCGVNGSMSPDDIIGVVV